MHLSVLIATRVIFLLVYSLPYVYPVNSNKTSCDLDVNEERGHLEEDMII